MTRRRVLLIGISAATIALALGTGVFVWREAGDRAAPRVPGRIVYVSDRSGVEQLYLRMLDTGEERQVTYQTEPVHEPAASPDGERVAFSVAGRVAILTLRTGETHSLTLGADWRDAEPSWRPDGQALVVTSRKGRGEPADLHELVIDADPSSPTGVLRRPLTETPGLDEQSPVYAADGRSVIYLREESLFRLDLATGHSRRLTSGFRKCRSPRRLPDGRFVYAWSLDKRHGIDCVDLEGKNHETLVESTAFYRTLSPASDGRHFLVTFGFDLSFHLKDALRPRRAEEIRLLGPRGELLGVLVSSWLHGSHSPCWLPELHQGRGPSGL